MIEFHYETEFMISNESDYSDWLTRVIKSEDFLVGQIDYIFCADDYLLGLNKKFLSHDTYTDIITFDYSMGRRLAGDVFISTDRVKENSQRLGLEFEEELLRVMVHGVLHLVGYSDKSKEELDTMRAKENEKIKMFHVEQ